MKKLDTALMTWGTSGSLDYATIAIKASVGLSIKFYGLVDAAVVKAPGQTYAVFRMRSSDVGDGLDQIGEEVVHDDAIDPLNAWPGIVWQKGDATYRSTSIGFLIPAAYSNVIALSEAFDKLDPTTELLCLMTKLAGGEEHIAVTRAGLDAYLDATLFKVREKIREAAKKMQPEAGEPLTGPAPGAFFCETDILKNLAMKHAKPNLDDLGVKDGDEEGDGVNEEDEDGEGED